jgi:hypothetical protein
MNNDEIRGSYRNLRMQNVPREDAIKHLAEELGRSPDVVRGVIDKKPVAETFDADNGFTADTPRIRDGFSAFATSTLYRGKDEGGEVVLQWVKESRNNEKRVAEELIKSMAEELPKVQPSEPRSKEFRSDTIAVYPMGDPHFGMFAWGEESEADFDLKIAEHDLCSAVDRLVETVPACEHALIINLGDFFHADNSASRTQSGHILDTDTRWAKVLRVGIKAIRQCIESALRKHKHVTVINAIGNHDEHSAMFLSVALSNVYENEPRVTINDSPRLKHYHRFGKNLFGVHHGHTIKMKDLPMQMAADKPEDWGDTKHRFIFTGHIHHDSKIEESWSGVIVESFRTLAPKDSYHAGRGYKSARDMKSILFHKDFGEIERHTVSVEML